MELVSIRYQNVRAFFDATLPLENEKTLIVGRNHAGKTSALLLLAWLINEADADRLYNSEPLNERDQSLLLPARSTRHTARRISLTVRISDGRVGPRFNVDDDDNAILRVGFRITGHPCGFIQLGPARKGGGAKSEDKAWDLLKRIQDEYSVIHIPSARDATSPQFQKRFKDMYRAKLTERALHPGRQSGTTTEYRRVVAATTLLKETADSLLSPMLEEVAKSLPNGMLQSSKLTFRNNTEQSVVDWIVDQVALKLITGNWDNSGVAPSNVGAGLQSVLDIAAASVIVGEGQKKLIVAVEEPEAFLHPSLQRTIARTLLAEEYGYKTFVSTHSPILVEESKYESIVLAVDGTIREPRKEGDQRQSEIHTAILSGQGAEMLFATSVLLVEGEGDRAFFEGLRRRLAKQDSSGSIDNLYVVQVGGKTSFGPWIRLLRALNRGPGAGPISYLIVPDGDATSDVQRALIESGITIPRRILLMLQNAKRHLVEGDLDAWRSKLSDANHEFKKSDFVIPLQFLDGDLEYAMLSGMSEDKCTEFAKSVGVVCENKGAFIKIMGSKAIDGKGGDRHKAPYMRKQLAENIHFSDLSNNIKEILSMWITNAGIARKEARSLMADT